MGVERVSVVVHLFAQASMLSWLGKLFCLSLRIFRTSNLDQHIWTIKFGPAHAIIMACNNLKQEMNENVCDCKLSRARRCIYVDRHSFPNEKRFIWRKLTKVTHLNVLCFCHFMKITCNRPFFRLFLKCYFKFKRLPYVLSLFSPISNKPPL